MSYQILISGSVSIFLLMIVISGLIRRKHKDIILPTLNDSYDQVIRLSADFRKRYGLTLQDRVDIKFSDSKEKKRLYLFKARKEDVSNPYIPLQILISIYGDKNSIPDPTIGTYKLSYPDYIRRASANLLASFVALMTLYLALQQSILKIELLKAIIYCSILSSIWTLYHSSAADWTFGLKDIFTTLKIFLQNKIGGKNYDYFCGRAPVLITVPHATNPGGEVLVEYISTEIAKQLNAHLIIGRISRTILDLNRSIARSSPFRKKIRELIEKNAIFLILDIHGFSSKLWKTEMDVEIGTSNLKTAKLEIRDEMEKALKENGITVSADGYFKGSNLPGNIINSYGNANTVNALQIEINRKIRTFKSEKLEMAINGIIRASQNILSNYKKEP